MNEQAIADIPEILTTTVGSYPLPDWLAALPSEQALIDATRVVFDTQRQARQNLADVGNGVAEPASNPPAA